MRSPFPGMDPYLERHWGDVHARLIMYMSDWLQGRLPGDLRARVEGRLVVEPRGVAARVIVPDVRVVERPRREPAAGGGGGGVAVAEPEVEVEEYDDEVDEPLVLVFDEERTEGFIEIVEAGTRDRVVTVLEVLSPANKRPGRDQDKYLQQREELLRCRINLVEIDLLRAGDRILAAPQEMLPDRYRTPYRVCVRRAARPLEAEVYRAPLRRRLPRVRVPLRDRDPDVRLDLQAVVELAYKNGGYDDIDYKSEPDPPLDPEDARWADARLREAQRR